MESTDCVLFRGRAEYDDQQQCMLVYPDSSEARSCPLEIAGAHTAGARVAVEIASESVSIGSLVDKVAQSAAFDRSIAGALVSELVEHRVLLRVVPADERVEILGDDLVAQMLRACMKSASLPRDIGLLRIAVLGTIGTAPWRENLERARGLSGPVLSCSLDFEGGWIGPVIDSGTGPCPACLAARRLAAAPALAGHAPTVSHRPAFVASFCAHVLEWAERFGLRELADDAVLHVTRDRVMRRVLLPQPGCRYCARADSGPSSFADRKTYVESLFAAELALVDRAEPTQAQRAAFLDDALGPVSIEEHHAPGLLRDLPLVLGSLRFMQPVTGGLERRELFSVTFGSGMTEARRRLVAFAEGVERYAGICQAADITGKTFDELAPYAFPPEHTIRFLTEQYGEDPDAPRPYDGQPVDWSWVYDWTAGESKLLIHDAVAFSHVRSPGTFRLFEDPFSSGTAAHRSMAFALERALLELIERDAFVLAWYLRLPLQEIAVLAHHDAQTWEMKEYLTVRGVDLRFYDLRVDFDVPCVLAVARASRDCGPWHSGGIILSASAGATWVDAARHAVQEILGHYSVFGVVSPEGDKSIDPATGKLRPWWQMFARYLEPRSDEPLSFLGRGESKALHEDRGDTMPIEHRLAGLREQFLARGLPVLVRRLGGRDVEASGLTALRVCIPGLLRLAPTRETVNFGEARVEQVRARWRVPGPLNPLPHPLA